MTNTVPLTYTRNDFRSDQTVRWCPGCGDYSILAQVQRVMPQICSDHGILKENVVFISGIGCSSRFPYYMNTFGFHSIHGRAPTLATGLKIARPDLQVWIVTGDGDGLSIGGNHLMHTLRRNLDVKILLFNNRIYGLTKGQYSPTSELGKKTKSSPYGVTARPVDTIALALASGATFAARTIDTETKHLQETLTRAAAHRGTAYVEILQNCNIFNDGAFDHLTEKSARAKRLLYLRHGEPMVYGAEQEMAIVSEGIGTQVHLECARIEDSPADHIIVHDETSENDSFVYGLAKMDYPAFPVPIGVFRAQEHPTYEDLVEQSIEQAREKLGPGDLASLLDSGDTWTVS